MAIIFLEDQINNPGGLQKLQIDEENLTEKGKANLEKFKDESSGYTSKEMMMGNSKGTVPDDGKIEVQGGDALVNEINNKKDDGGGDDEKKSGFKQFISSVG